MKRIRRLLILVLTSAVLLPVPSSAQSLPGLEDFLASLPLQAAPLSPTPPFRVQPRAYPPAAGLSGERLFQFLHKATVPTITRGGTAYLNAKKYMFSVSDNTGCGGGAGVTGLYSQVCSRGASEHGEDYKEQGDANGDGYVDSDGMNAEHSWPQGFFNQAYPMRADLHHVFPTYTKPNNARGSEPFAAVSIASYSTKSGSKLGPEGFEPANAVKGNIARAILYFVVRYYDKNIRDGMNYREFWSSRVPMFLEWDRQDPPDARELRRNALISAYQGNRNPFVDDTTLAPRVGAAVFQAH